MKILIIFFVALSLLGEAIFAQPNASVVITNTIGTVNVPGSPMTWQCKITNIGTTTQIFGVGAEVEQIPYPYNQFGQGSTTTLGPNAYCIVPITGAIPAVSTGTYTAHAVVWSGTTSGSGTDLDETTKTFTIQNSLSGRLCVQVYSAYLATETAANPLDGNLLLYNLSTSATANVTGTLAVENAVNPHFSSDGAKIVFAGIPRSMVVSGTTQPGTSLRIFVYDLAEQTLTQLTDTSERDEDASFAPNGQTIVFKRTPSSGTGQLWTMNSDGSEQTQLTFTSDEKSGPNYSPDGSTIVYFSGAGSNAEICTVSATNGSNVSTIVSLANIEAYYPVYSGSNDILYTRWISATNQYDEICDYSISSATSQILTTNTANYNFASANNSDPFPVNATLMGFSSTQYTGTYAPYLGRPSNGAVYSFPYVDTTLKELGGTYTPYSNSRELEIVSPTTASSLVAGGTTEIIVKAWSNGGGWSGASPLVTFQSIGATGTTQYMNLLDNGVSGGAESYAATVTLPQTTGSYAVIATGTYSDNRLTNLIASTPINVSLASSLPNWRLTYFGTTSNSGSASDTATPYSNGVPNLAAFAFRGPNANPAKVTINQLPQVQIANGNIFFSFTEPTGVSGINYGAEWSTNLANWTPLANSGTGTAYRFSMSTNGYKQLFLRLTVTDP